MTYPLIDARGRSCPEPVVLTKQALGKAPERIEVLVDNKTAQDNVSRFAKIAGYQVQTEQDGADFRIILSR